MFVELEKGLLPNLSRLVTRGFDSNFTLFCVLPTTIILTPPKQKISFSSEAINLYTVANQPKKLTQLDIAKLLRNLDRDSSKLVNGLEVLGHTKPEKSEISEGKNKTLNVIRFHNAMQILLPLRI